MKKKYSISGIDCANCAAKLEAKMNELPEVDSVTLTFATRQLAVEAEDHETALEKLRELAEKMEPGTVIEEIKRGRREHKHEHHHEHHEHEHRHSEGEKCCCEGHEHHEHGHHHVKGESCGCGEHHHHEHGHHHAEGDKCSCGEHHHHEHDSVNVEKKSNGIAAMLLEEKKELLTICIGAVLFAAGLICEKVVPSYSFISLAVFIVGYLILGSRVLLAAGKNIVRGKIFDENFLMSIATIGAFVIGEYPEAMGVMLFYRVGELFEEIAVGKSRKQIMEAVDMRPDIVRLVVDGEIKESDPEDIAVGDIVEVRVGDKIPLDGKILKGQTRIDTSAVTGEPVPVSAVEGSHVVSGCVNMSGVIYIEVEKGLEESMVTRILDAVENAAASKPKIDRFITKFAAVYTPIVVVAAVLTAVVPSIITGDWNYWIYTALTFLVISCPCALVLSVPLAFFSGIGAGSKQGILFKGGVSLEALADIKAVVMDKTGTVTEGNFSVAEVKTAEGVSEEKLLSYAGSAEKLSTHPIAVSIMEEVKARNIQIPEVIDIKEISGKGMEVSVSEGKILCGNSKLLEMNNVDIPVHADNIYGTEVLLALNGKYIGHIIINDTIKNDSKEAVAEMKRQGLFTAMLTGDAEENAKNVADTAGIDEIYARQLPEDKINNLVKIREKHGAVMFVGDGINDAPVLAGADVGAAMGSGADAAIEAADVVFMNSALSAVPESIRIAKRTKRIAMQNVVGALVIKAAIMVLGFAGIASMWAAVFADTGVAMLCVLNSVRVLVDK